MLTLPFNIFVYGTLKPGYSGFQEFCRGFEVESSAACARGKLYHLPAGYPAMTVGNDWVQGYLLSFNTLAVLPALDTYEDYDPNKPATANLYNREQIQIYLSQSTNNSHTQIEPTVFTTAWAYLMSATLVEQLGGQYLPHGQWLETNSV
jgi:gamma-glutamylcyclotransferase (GGCT)/AIG2-like uncharacterized protein YtfP